MPLCVIPDDDFACEVVIERIEGRIGFIVTFDDVTDVGAHNAKPLGQILPGALRMKSKIR